MPLPFARSFSRKLLLGLCTIALSAMAFSAWRHFCPVTASNGWDYGVYRDGISKVSALSYDGQTVYASQELSDGKGKILGLHADGSVTEVLTGLSKPDGQVMYRGGLVTGQEGGKLPVFWVHDGQTETLFEANNVEGIATDGRALIAIEDMKSGRLLRYEPESRSLSVLREGLAEGEGLSLCSDDRLFYTEKAKGWVKQWQPESQDKLIVDGLNAPGFVQCSDDGLWITEDATHGARLLLLDTSGNLQVILSHLRSAQTIIQIAPHHYLLAEQGRNRIIEIQRTNNN
jgi:hypothetical protein